uniref:Putative sugar O-methyltransferase n=1 Tax=Candidatus Kentrum sp. DK TaxID=2126562 RepID=A0A450T2D5_9GAMM|nr:MAG: putative sugar O-methyltransferase [Candidatus Kentron sp. DK]
MTYEYPELDIAREDMKAQSELYRPTAFWEEGSLRIYTDLYAHGIERFRSLPSALGYFVPTYGTPSNGLPKQQTEELISWIRRVYPDSKKLQLAFEQFLTGHLSALSDYRVLLAADIPREVPYLHTFSESRVGSPSEHFEFGGRRFSRSSLNYLLGLALLKKHLDGYVPRTVLEIGGGFGTLGEVLSGAGIQGLRYIDVDIPPTGFVAEYYLGEVLGKDKVATYAHTRNQSSIPIDALPFASVLCSWQIERLRGKVDLFVNFISFQEMEPHVVE